jgi:hypothetical protein
LIFDRIGGARHAALAVVVDQEIAGEPRQPNLERAFACPEALQRLKYAQKHLLRDILSLPIRAGETETNSIHASRMKPDQVLPGCFFAAQTAFD